MQATKFELLIHPSDDGSRPRRLNACTVNYNASQIPDAVIRVAVGKPVGRVIDNAIPADWLDELRKLRIVVRIEKYVNRTGLTQTEETVLFEGYPNAPAISLGTNTGELTINLQHWFRDLQKGNMLHEYAYPFNPEDRELEVLYPTPTAAGDTGGLGSVGYAAGLPSNWRSTISDDAWANGLKATLATFAMKPFHSQMFNKVNCGRQVNQTPPSVQEALRRIQGPSVQLGKPYTDGVPLIVRGDIEGDTRAIVANSLANLIGEQPLATFRGASFWDHLLRVCSNIFAEIVIRPTDALIVPFIPTPYGFHDVQILEDADIDLRWAETRQLGIRGTMVIAPRKATTGYDTISLLGNADLMAAGCYTDNEDPDQGRIFPISAPDFLSNLLLYSDTQGAVSNNLRQTDPANGGGPTKPAAPLPQTIGNMFNRYAQLRFVEEALRYRKASITTKFRTDICVGSTVAVAARTDTINKTVGSDTTVIVGRVTASTHQVDRASKRAVSQFALSYVTTLQEMENRRYVVDEHPFFSTKFLGAKLA